MGHSQPIQRRRRPRVHFDPSLARRYEMGMIQAGWETLQALHQFRFLTSWQVAKLLFLGRPNLTGTPRNQAAARKAANERCLRRLKDRQLVETRQVMMTHQSSWRRQEYQVLTRTGHQLLRDYLTTRGEALVEWDPARVEIAPEALPHALALNDVAIAFSRSCEHHGASLLAWIDDLAGRVKLGQLTFGGVIPDAMVLIAQRQRHLLGLVELDRGSEPVVSTAPNAWQTKMDLYRAFFADGFAREPFFAGQPAPLLLTITTSSARLEHLLAETDRSGPADRTYFALQAWLEPPYDALGEIWRRPTGGELYYSLLDQLALAPA